MRRSGWSLVELLVVLALTATLTGLGLAGVQRARAAAARAACANNLRQLALGLHAHHAAHGRLPAGVTGMHGRYPFFTWGGRLLPHLDQPAAWAEATEDYAAQRLFSRPVPHRNLARPLPVFLCPADGRQVGTTDDGVTAAFSFYLGVVGGAGPTRDGVLYQDSAVRLAEVTDGTSSTLLLGERPPSTDNHFGWWYAGIGQSVGDGTADSVMGARETNRTFRAPQCPVGPYPFQDGRADDPCSTFHFWSRHPGGGHFAFADGAVRFVRYPADPLLPALATRAGGEPAAGVE